MKRAALLLAAWACAASAAAQAVGAYGLSSEGQRSLEQLRQRRSEGALLAAPALDRQLAERTVQLADPSLNEVVLRELSSPNAKANIHARVRMNELSRIAQTPEGAAALADAGWNSEQLRALSLRPQAPTLELQAMRRRFGVDARGRLLVRPDILIVKPDTPAPDNLVPGQLKPGHQGPTPIWRRGLLFAVAIGTMNEKGEAQAFCSGTIVDRHWVVTAGHCLRFSGQRLPATRLFAFLPFQAGSLSVRNVAGGTDRQLRMVRVVDARWVGDSTGQSLPLTDDDMGAMVNAGDDVALLKLAEAEVNSLPVSIPAVSIIAPSAVKAAPVSLVGYGLSNVAAPEGLSLFVGVRDKPPDGVDTGTDMFYFGAASTDKAGLCGGDSGGGLFAGRLDGAPATPRHLFGVISGLVGKDVNTTNLSHCVSHQQAFTPLLSARNRDFICKSVKACVGNL